MDIYAVIVLYNKSYKDSVTFNCLLQEKGIKIIACDNSTQDFGNAAAEKEFSNVTYINMGGNMGLSKAYNRAVELVRKKAGYICLFDDDTQLPGNYFSDMRRYMEQTQADVLLPMVYDKFGYMSPSSTNGVKVVRIADVKELTPENITGINSGMAIRISVFDDFKYDEGYFLDCIDHAFIREMKRRNKAIAVAESVELHQDFSGNDFFHFAASKKRFKIFYKDFWYFCVQDGRKMLKVYAVFNLIYRWLYLYIVIRNYPFYSKHFRSWYHKHIKKDGKYY